MRDETTWVLHLLRNRADAYLCNVRLSGGSPWCLVIAAAESCLFLEPALLAVCHVLALWFHFLLQGSMLNIVVFSCQRLALLDRARVPAS